MHLVRLGFQPREKASRAVPDTLVPVAFTFDDPLATFSAELAPRRVDGNAALFGELDEVVLAFFVGLGLPGLDGTAAQGFALVRDDEAVVDADGPSEAAAALARADGGVERIQARVG